MGNSLGALYAELNPEVTRMYLDATSLFVNNFKSAVLTFGPISLF